MEGDVAPPFSQQAPPTGAMFAGSNVAIGGGSYSQHNTSLNVFPVANSNAREGFRTLREHVAASAFHNSVERGNPPKCHPDTRKAVFEDILNWIIHPEDAERIKWLMWLNGAPGAGKSAIEQSLAELCVERGILAASFFFFHADHTRNSLNPVVATLAYQLIQLVSSTRDFIVGTIESDPFIFQRNFDAQLQALIIHPLAQAEKLQRPAKLKLLLIIDSLDGCIDQTEQCDLIRSFTKLYAEKKTHSIIVLVGSRIESHLATAFNSTEVSGILQTIPLDGQRYDPNLGINQRYDPDPDIRTFLRNNFNNIKYHHHLQDTIDVSWPLQKDIDEIVARSSGQFLYASLVVKFVSTLDHPPTQLDIILRDSSSSVSTAPRPFADLDTVYHHIFSRIKNAEEINIIAAALACIVLTNELRLSTISSFLNIPLLDLRIALVKLTCVIAINNGLIHFLHASLLHFLLDKARSGQYHIDTATWSTDLCHKWFQPIQSEQLKGWSQENFIILVGRANEYHPDLQKVLQEHVRELDPCQTISKELIVFPFLSTYLSAIQSSKSVYGDDVYYHQIDRVTRFVRNEYPTKLGNLQRDHDAVTHTLDRINREEEIEKQEADRRGRTPSLHAEKNQRNWSIFKLKAMAKAKNLRRSLLGPAVMER